MTLDAAIALIKTTSGRMNELYQKTVFDEWAVVALAQHKAKLLDYLGPRKEDFQKNFLNDVQELRASLFSSQHEVGEFEFSRHGVGTRAPGEPGARRCGPALPGPWYGPRAA